MLGLELNHYQWPLTLLQKNVELCFESVLPLPCRLTIGSPAFLRTFVCIIYSLFSLWSLMGHFSRFSLQSLISLFLPSILCVKGVLFSHNFFQSHVCSANVSSESPPTGNSDVLLLLTSLFLLFLYAPILLQAGNKPAGP